MKVRFRLGALMFLTTVAASCGQQADGTIAFDGVSCSVVGVNLEATSMSVALTNSSGERVWIGMGSIAADATADSMLLEVTNRAFGANEAVMGLMDLHGGAIATQLPSGKRRVVQAVALDADRYAVWCVTDPNGSDRALLGGIIER